MQSLNVYLLMPILPATNGLVLATEKKQKSILYDEHSIHKIEMITKHSGLVYSGMGPDYRSVGFTSNVASNYCDSLLSIIS